MEKFTPLTKILHCRQHWRHGQIPPLPRVCLFVSHKLYGFLSKNSWNKLQRYDNLPVPDTALESAHFSFHTLFCDSQGSQQTRLRKCSFFVAYTFHFWFTGVSTDLLDVKNSETISPPDLFGFLSCFCGFYSGTFIHQLLYFLSKVSWNVLQRYDNSAVLETAWAFRPINFLMFILAHIDILLQACSQGETTMFSVSNIASGLA